MADIIKAAGGLIWRDNSGGREVAVIHRARYGDWTLPKGKLEPDEDWSEAALREVHEETGCEVQLESFAGEVRYTVGDRPKVVKFWNMTLAGPCDFKPSEEVDELAWMTVADAVHQLDYDGERNLLKSMASNPQVDPAPPGAKKPTDVRRVERPTYTEPEPTEWPKPRAILDLDYVSRKRLASLLPVYDIELQHLSHRAALKGDADAAGSIAAAQAQLDKTRDALKKGDADLGWQSLHSAQRMTLPVLQNIDPDYFQVVARAVYHESKAKLDSWRKDTVLDSLGRDDKDRTFDEGVSSSAVAASTLILHEHHGNVYQKIQASLQQLRILAIILLAAAVIFVGSWSFVEWNSVAESDTLPPLSLSALLAVALFGVMGACVSGIRQLAVGATKGKIPERLIAAWVTFTRPIVGAVAAMAIYFFLTGGIFAIIDIQAHRLEAYLAVAFAAGFSEQLVWRAAETLTSTRS